MTAQTHQFYNPTFERGDRYANSQFVRENTKALNMAWGGVKSYRDAVNEALKREEWRKAGLLVNQLIADLSDLKVQQQKTCKSAAYNAELQAMCTVLQNPAAPDGIEAIEKFTVSVKNILASRQVPSASSEPQTIGVREREQVAQRSEQSHAFQPMLNLQYKAPPTSTTMGSPTSVVQSVTMGTEISKKWDQLQTSMFPLSRELRPILEKGGDVNRGLQIIAEMESRVNAFWQWVENVSKGAQRGTPLYNTVQQVRDGKEGVQETWNWLKQARAKLQQMQKQGAITPKPEAKTNLLVPALLVGVGILVLTR
jgi:hypothetical protein